MSERKGTKVILDEKGGDTDGDGTEMQTFCFTVLRRNVYIIEILSSTYVFLLCNAAIQAFITANQITAVS